MEFISDPVHYVFCVVCNVKCSQDTFDLVKEVVFIVKQPPLSIKISLMRLRPK